MTFTRSDRYCRARDHLLAVIEDIEALSIGAQLTERLALDMVGDEARKALGALERTVSVGLATLDDCRPRLRIA